MRYYQNRYLLRKIALAPLRLGDFALNLLLFQ